MVVIGSRPKRERVKRVFTRGLACKTFGQYDRESLGSVVLDSGSDTLTQD